MRNSFRYGLFVFMLLTLVSGVINAQDAPTVITDGLNSPRGVFYGPDGTLYVTDAGVGGAVETAAPVGVGVGGGTSNVYTVAEDGTRNVLIYGLPSVNIRGTEAVGASDIEIVGDSVWLVLGQGSAAQAGNSVNPFSYAVVELDATNFRVKNFIDLYAYELANNPDGNEIDSNPVKIAVTEEGVVYIVDAGANALYQWTEDAGLEVFNVWSDNPVPTGVAIGPEGDLYVSFLTGFPFPEGGARIERWNAAGELVETFGGLTLVTDLAVDADGLIYAVQFGLFSLDSGGWVPDSGSVVEVSAEGITPIAEGLTFPYGIAINPAGGLTVTLNSGFSEPGTGSVVLINN